MHNCFIPTDLGGTVAVACACGIGGDHPWYSYRVRHYLGEE